MFRFVFALVCQFFEFSFVGLVCFCYGFKFISAM